MEFDHKYRVRRGFGGSSVLQVLTEIKKRGAFGDVIERYIKWVDVPFSEAPRALTTEIKE